MKCPHCQEEMEPIGYSIIELTYACIECEHEVDVLRGADEDRVIKQLGWGCQELV